MKSSWKIHVLTLGCMLALAGPAAAAETLLAKTDLRLADASVTAELWGDRLPSGYSDNLLVLLKDEQGSLVTAYAPSIKGGYYPMLEAVQVKPAPKKAVATGSVGTVAQSGKTAQGASAETAQQLFRERDGRHSQTDQCDDGDRSASGE